MFFYRIAVLVALIPVPAAQEADPLEGVLAAVRVHFLNQGATAEGWALEVVGEAVDLPDHSVWHAPGPPFPASLAGQVFDAFGAILPGCDLTLFRLSSAAPDFPGSTVSGPDGRFSFGNLLPGEYLLVTSHAGYVRKEIKFHLQDREQASLVLTLEVGSAESVVSVSSRASTWDLPQSLFLVLARKGREVRSFLVGGRPGSYAVTDPLPEGVGFLDGQQVTPDEWGGMLATLQMFYDVLLEVEGGLERFDSFLDDSFVQSTARGMRLAPDTARRYIAFHLDWILLQILRRIERIESRKPIGEGPEFENDPRQFLDLFDRSRFHYFEEVRMLGSNPAHRESLLAYVRRYLGEGLIGKVDFEDGTVFVTRLLPNMNLFFRLFPEGPLIVGLTLRD